LARVAAACVPCSVAGHEWLFRQDDRADAMFVVRSGRLEVVQEEGAVSRVLRVAARGDLVGELSLMTGSSRSAGVRAVRDSRLLRIPAIGFAELLSNDDFAAVVTRYLALQLQASGGITTKTMRRVNVLAVLSLLPDMSMSETILERLAGGLARFGRSTVVTSVQHGDTDPATLLDRIEQDNDNVLLLADGTDEDTLWDDFCLRQADQVLVLVDPHAPLPGRTLLRRLEGCDVAFCAPQPSATLQAPWDEALRPRARHLLRPGADLQTTVERMARRLCGRSRGIVLSGGGARGFAHIGVLSGLLEAGVEIDRVGGCSMGAFVGGLFAKGMSAVQMREVCYRELVLSHPFNDYTLPASALIKGRKALAMLRRALGSTAIDELSLDYFAVSADLASAELIVHRHGPLYEAVAISMSIPGLAPPTLTGRRLLVDGGVLDNLPVATMAETAEGPMIAVDVMGRRRLDPNRPSAMTARWRDRVVTRLRGNLPAIGEILVRTTVLGSWQTVERNKALAEVVISPEIADARLLDFRELDRMIDAGRRAADAALSVDTAAFGIGLLT
jgi:NTE family protein